MRASFRQFLSMRQAQDPERRQTAVRTVISFMAMALQLLLWVFWGYDSVRATLPFAAFHLLACCGWNQVITRCWFPRDTRLLICVALDNAYMAYAMTHAPMASMFALWTPLFSPLGNGLRYGSRWIPKSLAVTVPIYLAAMLFSGYWRSHVYLMFGFLATLLVIPLYTMRLSRLLINERVKAQERVAELEQRSRIDALTGAFNRSGIEHELATCLAHGVTGALIYIDLDGFKAVNDSAGHQVGDQMLQAVVGAMRLSLRNTDRVGRLGGDEFALVLPGSTTADAQRVADKLLVAIRAVTLEQTPLHVGASIGVCMFPVAGEGTFGAADVLALADERMYHAKRAGKNRVVAGPEFPPSSHRTPVVNTP